MQLKQGKHPVSRSPGNMKFVRTSTATDDKLSIEVHKIYRQGFTQKNRTVLVNQSLCVPWKLLIPAGPEFGGKHRRFLFTMVHSV